MIALSKIRIDGGTQARVELNQETVAEYAEAYRSGAAMPPVVLFYDGTTYWLADGFHRYFGAKQAGLAEIWEEITPGTKRDAVLFSLAANARHGLRRTNADKRKAVSVLLNDPEWSAWSDNDIAKRCSVSNHLVADVKKSLTWNSPSEKPADVTSFSRSEESPRPSLATVASEKPVERTYTTKHGTPATMNTANIGKKPAAPIQEEPEYNPDDYALAEAQETVCILAAENDALKDRLAVAAMPGTEAEKADVLGIIAALRKEVANLEAELSAVKASRDGYQQENAELKRQCSSQRRQLAKEPS